MIIMGYIAMLIVLAIYGLIMYTKGIKRGAIVLSRILVETKKVKSLVEIHDAVIHWKRP